MKTSPQGLQFLMREEGCVLHPYNDAHGYATIGVGHLIGLRPVTATDQKKYRGFTEKAALELLRRDVARFEAAVNRLVKVGLTQPQFDALVSFAYNCGEGGLAESQLLRDLNSGHKNMVTADLHHWDDGGLLKGRRTREGVLFAQGDYGPGIGVYRAPAVKKKPAVKKAAARVKKAAKKLPYLGRH